MDLKNLDQLITDYFRYIELASSSTRADRLEAEWQVVVGLVDGAPDDDALGIVAAGPLADMLRNHAAQFGERIVEQTRRDRRFRETIGLIHHWEGVPATLHERIEALAHTNN